MRSISTTVAITAAGLLLFSQFAQASDVEAELRQMQERIADLENQLDTDETDSFLPNKQKVGSALSSMIENTDISGWLAPSYNYNFEGMHNGATAGGNVSTAATHPNTNTFQLDQAWIAIDNAATEDGRGGVHMDMEWGVIGGGVTSNLYSAYLSYLAPVHEGVQVDVGLFPTLLGAEVQQTNANFNVTRGLVWGLQPVTNVGAVVSGTIMEGLSAAIGVLNDPLATPAIDGNNEKAVTAQIAYAADIWSVSAQMVWGGSDAAGGDVDTGIYDVVISVDPSDDISAWFDFTIVDVEDTSTTAGLAAAARMALSDELGVALRGEVVVVNLDGPGGKNNIWSVTATGDYAITDHLTAKAEIRIDIDEDNLPDDRGVAGEEDVAAMILAQFIYEF